MRFSLLFFLLISVIGRAESFPSPSFVRNDGQWEKDILFRAEIPGGILFLKKQALHYVFYHTGDLARQHPQSVKAGQPAARQAVAPDVNENTVRMHGFKITFLNADPGVQLEAKDEKIGVQNYLLGNDPARWASDVPAFAQIIYKNIYPGIDLRLFSQNGTFKYEFLVAAQANPDAIQLKYEGMSSLSLDNGFLVAETSVNKVTETPPYTYQYNKRGIKQEVASAFVRRNDIVSFAFPKGFNRKSAMVIDPILVFSTYSGSFSDNWGFTATYDNDGHLYSGGIVFGNNLVPTEGAFQTTFSGQVDIAIFKYTPNGNTRVYATYIGGSEVEVPHSMIVNAANELVILGTTSSLNYPVTINAYDRSFNGGSLRTVVGMSYLNGSDIVVTKLNAAGVALVGSTYLGGSQNDGLNYDFGLRVFNYGDEFRGEVNLDQQGNIYLASTTVSGNFPLVSPSQNNRRGLQDAVVCQFNPTLSALTWSTFLGGSGFDAVRGIRVAPSGRVYVAGGTTSRDLPVSPGVLKTSLTGTEDGFVARFENRQLSRLSYLGTNREDQAYLIDIDNSENVYVMGLTFGNYPVSRGVYSNANGKQFIHAMNENLSRTLFSTVVGSGRPQPDISPTAFMLSSCGFIYLSGWGGDINSGNGGGSRGGIPGSSTTGLPVTANAYRNRTNGDDYYLAILDQNARQLLYGTFFGSEGRDNHVDGGTSRFSPDGTIYHAACACRDNSRFPTTNGAHSTINWGSAPDNGAQNTGCNNAAFKFDLEGLTAAFELTSDNCGLPAQISVTNGSQGGQRFEWLVNGQVRSTASTPTQLTLAQAGEYTITLRAYNPLTCKKVDSVSRKITVSGPVFNISPDTTLCPGQSVRLSADGGIAYQWTPATGIDNPRSATPTVTPTQATTYTVDITSADGCIKRLRTQVLLNDFEPDFEILTQSECGGPTRLRLVNKTEGTEAEWELIDSVGVSRKISDTISLGNKEKRLRYEILLRAFRGNCEETIRKPVTIDPTALPVNVITDHAKNSYFETYRRGWKLEVYDQWGRPVYQNDAYQNDWTAADAKNTTYYYKLTSPDGVACKGWLQILR